MTFHFVDGTEPGTDGCTVLARRALALRAGAAAGPFDRHRMASVFLNPSLRTRTSIEAACHALGMHNIVLSPGTNAWKLEATPGAVMHGDAAEHVADAVPVLCQYVDMVAVRAFAKLVDREEDRADPVLSAFCEYSAKPIINMESARFHPLQGLADAATWFDHLGEVKGAPITLTWAPHPKALPAAVPNQVMLNAALLGANLTIAHPERFDLDPDLVSRATSLAQAAGGSVNVTHDPDEGVEGAQVVVAKSWSGFSGYGRREEESAERAQLGHWCVSEARMGLAEPEAGFMHCLPLRRNVVATDAVVEGPQSWVVETAGLRMWTAMALFEAILEKRPWTV